MNHFTWIITIASIIGTVANIYKQQWCFVVWLCTNVAWSAYDFAIGEYSQAVLFSVYAVLALWGIWQWRQPARRVGLGEAGEE